MAHTLDVQLVNEASLGQQDGLHVWNQHVERLWPSLAAPVMS